MDSNLDLELIYRLGGEDAAGSEEARRYCSSLNGDSVQALAKLIRKTYERNMMVYAGVVFAWVAILGAVVYAWTNHSLSTAVVRVVGFGSMAAFFVSLILVGRKKDRTFIPLKNALLETRSEQTISAIYDLMPPSTDVYKGLLGEQLCDVLASVAKANPDSVSTLSPEKRARLQRMTARVSRNATLPAEKEFVEVMRPYCDPNLLADSAVASPEKKQWVIRQGMNNLILMGLLVYLVSLKFFLIQIMQHLILFPVLLLPALVYIGVLVSGKLKVVRN